MSRRPRVESSASPLFEDPSVPEYERNMNPEQLAVIRHEEGPIACYAGAGSGKTRALVHRVVRLVSHVGVSPDRIFCVTFSRPGAEEMAARVRLLGVGGVEVKTWHAFCTRVLREEGVPEGKWEIGDKVEPRAKNLVKQAGGYKYENWVGMDLTKVRSFIGICKANLWDAGSPEALELAKKKFGSYVAHRAVRVFQISQRLIEEAGLLTFDDMLVFIARYFARDEEMRQRWAAKFDYVMTDEAQDNNIAQVTLARMLAKDHRNLMVVGDPGQAIYGFRGSSPVYLTDFPAEWDAKVVTMAKNYRSGAAIVEVANAIIREGSHRLPEDMSAERGVEGEVRTLLADNLDDEASEFVDFCKAHVAAGKSLSEVNVLFRLNAQSRALEEALLREKLPYVLIGGVNFYERKAVKDLLAYLRLAAGADKEGDAFKRCINAPFRFLGAKFVERAMALAASGECSIDGVPEWTQVVSIAGAQTGIQERQRPSIREWVEIIEHVRSMIVDGVPSDVAKCTVCGRAYDLPRAEPHVDQSACVFAPVMVPASAADVLGYVVKATNYVAWLEKEEGEESIESSHAADVREMQRVAASFKSVGELLAFVDDQVKESALNKRKRGDRCVTMMSCHKSKGLEWPVVWLVGCNDAILPHAKGDIEEERRIMYVAATRARDTLVVSYVKEMAMRTGVRAVEPSPFLDAFPGFAEPELDLNTATEEELEAAAKKAEDEIVAAHPGIDTNSDEYLTLLAGQPIVDGMTAAERESVAEYEASGQAARDEKAWAEADAGERNPGSVRELSPTLAAIFGEGTCLDCKAPLATHGEDCAG